MKLIKKIEIKHFRSIFEQTLEELESIVIFGGKNDSGKSNILRALNLFFNGKTSFMEEFAFSDDFSMSSKVKARESKKGRQFISIKIYFDENEIKGSKNELVKLIKENHSDFWVERKWWAYSEDETYEQSEPDYIKNASPGIKRSFSIFLQSVKFVYIPAFKSTDVFSYILKLSARNNGLFLGKNAKNELDENIEKTTKDFSNDFRDITGVETLVTLPISLESFWSSLEINSQFEGTPDEITRGSRDDYKIKFTSRGEGIKSLFIPVLLGWLAKKAKDNHWIWGIDEPENALEALRADNLFSKLVEYSEYAQIFLSTHSPSFIFPQESISICSIFISEQNKPGYTLFKRIDSNLDSLKRQFGVSYTLFMELQKEYSKKIKELDQKSKEIDEIKSQADKPLIFTEGPTDKKVLETAWKLFNPESDLPYIIKDKGGADGVAYVLENGAVFEKTFIFGLFDFDAKGYQKWNGLASHKYFKISNTTHAACLMKKHQENKFYAILLPVPDNDLQKQVMSDNNNDFGDKSYLVMEHLFWGVEGLEKYFVEDPAPGGKIIKFSGNVDDLILDAKIIGERAFLNFKPIFERIKEIVLNKN